MPIQYSAGQLYDAAVQLVKERKAREVPTPVLEAFRRVAEDSIAVGAPQIVQDAIDGRSLESMLLEECVTGLMIGWQLRERVDELAALESLVEGGEPG